MHTRALQTLPSVWWVLSKPMSLTSRLGTGTMRGEWVNGRKKHRGRKNKDKKWRISMVGVSRTRRVRIWLQFCHLLMCDLGWVTPLSGPQGTHLRPGRILQTYELPNLCAISQWCTTNGFQVCYELLSLLTLRVPCGTWSSWGSGTRCLLPKGVPSQVH